MSVCPHCRAARERSEQLEEELRQVREHASSQEWVLPGEWRLTRLETVLMRVLLERQLVTPQVFLDARAAERPTADEVSPKMLDVMILKLRRKLAPWGVKIETRYGVGYHLSPETRPDVLTAVAHGRAQVGPPVDPKEEAALTRLLIAALAGSPEGLTASEIAARIAPQRSTVSAVSVRNALTRVAQSGDVEVLPVLRRTGGKPAYVYRLPAQAQHAEAA
jgi:hypothetical protein